ncbi:MAG: PxxKW family cysteine-rich protein [bacterium]
MECTLLEAPVECHFATKGENGKNGCGYNGESCYPVVEECLKGDDETKACASVVELPKGKYCSKFPNPENRWSRGRCPLATHVKVEYEAPLEKKLNPLKASKRAVRGS